MAPLYDGHDYYKRMFELQEKLRKSEEERIRLEERFNVLVQESRNRHNSCINRLRMRYIEYLEEQRTRDERNHNLLTTLNKTANKLAMISAKKDKLNVLRKQYEAYLLRIYANRQPTGSVTGDSGITSQNEDKYARKLATINPDLAFPETKDISPRVHRTPPQSSPPRTIYAPKFHDQSSVNISVNNPPTLPQVVTPSAPSGVDYHRTNILRGSHNYNQPGDQLIHQLRQPISTFDVLRVPQTTSGYDRSMTHNLQSISNLRVPHRADPLLTTALSQPRPDSVTAVNQFFKQHMEPVQAASADLPTIATFSAGDARRKDESVRSHASRQFDSSIFAQPFRYHDTNVLLSDAQSRIKDYVPADATTVRPALTPKSSEYAIPMTPEMNVVNQVGPLPGYADYILSSPQRSEDDESTRSFVSDDADDLIRRNERLLWRNADVARTASRYTNGINLDENVETTEILESELDRYISNIRKLHWEHGVPNQDEMDHEQNTSGDLLNVTLSEEAQDLPTEDKARREKMPEEMDRILALASDLASRTAEVEDVAVEQRGALSAEIGDEIRDRNGTRGDASEEKRGAFANAEGRDISATAAGYEIREDVTTHPTELEQPHKDANIAKENWNDTSDLAREQKHDREVSNDAKRDDNLNEEIIATLNNELPTDDRRIVPEKEEERFDLVTGEESNVEDPFDTVEELAPWDLASVQKKIRELHLDTSNDDRAKSKEERTADDEIYEELTSSQLIDEKNVDGKEENSDLPRDILPSSEPKDEKSKDVNEIESHEENETRARIEENVSYNNPNEDGHEEHKIDEVDEVADVAPLTNEEPDERNESNIQEQKDNYETSEARSDNQPENIQGNNVEEYNVGEGYAEDSNQIQQYEQDPNEQYNYGENLPYETAGAEYENYANQGYAQDSQEYVEYVDGQYEQYAEDPNNQQYQQDINAQYQQDQAYNYDYDQQYDQQYNQQYDQGYVDDPNQAYGYAEGVPYDPDQAYQQDVYQQGEEYKEEYKEEYNEEYKEQQAPDDNDVNVEDREGEPVETVALTEDVALQKKADSELERKEDAEEAKQSEENAISETDQPKKKKDVIKSLLDSDTDTTIERNISNTESDFDFN